MCSTPSTLGFAIPRREAPPTGFSLWEYSFCVSATDCHTDAGLWKLNPLESCTWVLPDDFGCLGALATGFAVLCFIASHLPLSDLLCVGRSQALTPSVNSANEIGR